MNSKVSIGVLIATSIILTILTASPISHAQPNPTVSEFPTIIIIASVIVLISLSSIILKTGR
jgi:hypothetical protein